MLEIGSILDGKYKILNKVGQGGMSVVYLAMNERANKQWAVKEVRKDGVLDFESVKQGLIAETDILKKLSHKHLPSIIDVIELDDSFIIIMDYVQGNSLDKALKHFGAQPQELVIDWAKQLCDVLHYLHTRTPPIIYRDMKPSNVMLKPDGSISLIDFGTAREHKVQKTADTTCLGTRGYAAPEQYGGMGQTDARTDIYCLGATMYHLVTGKNPSEPPYEILPIRTINPNLSTGLEKIINKCTQNNPADRYQSCAELMYDLEHFRDYEDEHLTVQRQHVKMFSIPLILTGVFALTSLLFLLAAASSKNATYNRMLAEAKTAEDYYEVILTDPTRTEAYLGTDDYIGLIDRLTGDGSLSIDDASELQRLKLGIDSADVLKLLHNKDKEEYAKVCHKIGEAYLFYYVVDSEKDRFFQAASWFKETVEYFPDAKIYCDISDCLTNIAKYEAQEQSSNEMKEYEALWKKMEILYTESLDLENDLKLNVWEVLNNMIYDHPEQFCTIATESRIEDLLNDIIKETRVIDDPYLTIKISDLQESIGSTLKKLSTAQTKK